MLLLDTHVLTWLVMTPERLGRQTRRLLDRGLEQAELAVSAVSFWEIALHVNVGKIRFEVTMDEWRRRVLDLGIHEVPLDGRMAVRSAGLLDHHRDPGDRFIAATALLLPATLVTADEMLLAWKTSLKRQNAEL